MTPPLGPLPLSLSDRLTSLYKEWGVENALAEDSSPMTESVLAAMLTQAEPSLQTGSWRTYASSFDPDSEFLRAFPRPLAPRWPSLERLLRTAGARAAMLRLPHFWQMESPAHAACRTIGAPLFVSEPENMPVGAAAIASLGIDTLVIDADESEAFASYLSEKRVPLPRTWILIHRPAQPLVTPSTLSAPGLLTAHEIHALPGIPALEQCALLAARSDLRFHAPDGRLIEPAEGTTYVTSLGDDPFPLRRFVVPLSLREGGSCPCGRPAFAA